MAPLPLHTWLDGAPPPGGRGAAGACAVVVDVLRASSTIVAALGHGASYVVARAEVDDAFAAREELERRGEGPVLGGERGGRKVPGFDLGNSPLEYGAERVAGKPIVLCTSNGTAALERCREAPRVFAGAFLNAAATAAAVARGAEPVVLCCAGKEGAPSLEDACCAGLIASRLLEAYAFEADDATAIALLCWKKHAGNVGRMLANCNHGRYLAALGFERDLEFCGQVDAFDGAAAQTEGGKLVGVAPPQPKGTVWALKTTN
jgi:2-phosphosulfolactate phosphatase